VRLLVDAQAVQSTSALRGIGRYSISLLRALVEQQGEHEVAVLLNAGDDSRRLLRARRSLETFLPGHSIHVFDAPWPWHHRGTETRAAAEAAYAAAVASLQPDVLLVLSVFEGDRENVLSVRRLVGRVPVAAVLYDLIPAADPGTYLLGPGAADYWRRFEELAAADRLLSISDYSAGQARRLLGDRCPPVTTIWGGPFPAGAFPDYEQRGDERPDLALPERYLLTVGGDHPRKNLDRLVAAWGRLLPSQRAGSALVVACGLNPGTVRRLRRSARRRGLSERDLVLTGRVSDTRLASLYARAQGFVFPSMEEGLGMPALEAMAVGTPTALAHGSSLVELIDTREAFFDGTSERDIAETLERLLNDHAYRDLLSHAARSSTDRFTWAAAARRAWRALTQLPRTASDPPAAPRLVRLGEDDPEAGPSGVALRWLDLAGRRQDELRASAAPAACVVVESAEQASELVQEGLLDTPLVGPHDLDAVAAHDPVTHLGICPLPDGAHVLPAALASPARWTLQRPRPAWLLLHGGAPPTFEALRAGAARRGADLVVAGADGVALSAWADAVAVLDPEVEVEDLLGARCRGAVVLVSTPVVRQRQALPDWVDVVDVAHGWEPLLDSLAGRGRTCGWPWHA